MGFAFFVWGIILVKGKVNNTNQALKLTSRLTSFILAPNFSLHEESIGYRRSRIHWFTHMRVFA